MFEIEDVSSKPRRLPELTVTCDQSFPLLTIWPLAVSYVETRSYPSRISQYWSNILRSRGNGAISQEIRDDSSSNKVSFSMIHSLSNTHLPLRGFCFESIIKRCLMMVILFCRPQPPEVVINRRQCRDWWKNVFKYDGKYEVMNH